MNIQRTLTTLAIVAVLAGCGSTEPLAAGDDADTGTAAPTILESEPEPTGLASETLTGDEGLEEGVADEPADGGDGEHEPDHSIEIKGAVWKAEGVRLRVTHLALTDRTAFCETFPEFEEPEACYPDIYPGETIVAMDMRVVNNSDRDIEFYPDQAVLVLGSEQVDEAMLLGPDAIGGTIRDGVDQKGQAWWLSEQPVDDVHALGEMRMIIGSPSWADDFEPVTGDYEDIDLTVKW